MTCELTYEQAVETIPCGRYRHFKGNEYEVIGIARSSETEEPMVVYKALYGEGCLWVRPAGMWNEIIERDGETFRRFERVENSDFAAGSNADDPGFRDDSGEDVQAAPGMITRTCRICGKVFTLPENVQHWPDCCQECRAKYQPVEMLTRRCRGCGKDFTFSSDAKRWPKYCPDCQAKRKRRSK